jgi:hypothetical protein
MPLQTETVHFSNEIQRLEQEREDLAEQVADLDDDNPEIERLAQQGQELDSFLQGLRWACEEWDVDSVTLAGLTGGEFGKVEDGLSGAARDNNGPSPGATRVHLVAEGTVEAPYISEEMSDREKISAVSQLPLHFLKWAESRVDTLSTVGEDTGNSFGDLVAEKRADANSTAE